MGISIKDLAKICHEANKAYCECIGDNSQVSWDEAPDWQKESAIKGAEFHFEGDMTPEQSHISWYRQKERDGWKYGAVKDAEKKEHPCMVPYCKLPEEQQQKDKIFKAICDSFKRWSNHKNVSSENSPYHKTHPDTDGCGKHKIGGDENND